MFLMPERSGQPGPDKTTNFAGRGVPGKLLELGAGSFVELAGLWEPLLADVRTN